MAVPVCSGCLHPHRPEETCPTCGHVAVQKHFPDLHELNPAPFSLRFECFGLDQAHTGLHRQCLLMRTAAFEALRAIPSNLVVPTDSDGDAMEAKCRHILALIGDAPVACIRYRLSVDTGAGPGCVMALFDRWTTLPVYRRKGLAEAVMAQAMADLLRTAAAQNQRVTRILAFLPEHPALTPAYKALTSFGFRPERKLSPGEDPSGCWNRNREAGRARPEWAEASIVQFTITQPEMDAALRRVSAKRGAAAVGRLGPGPGPGSAGGGGGAGMGSPAAAAAAAAAPGPRGGTGFGY